MAYAAQRFGFSYDLTPWVRRLLIANTAVFFVTLILGRDFFFQWFGFAPASAFTRPWTVLTYMFLHGDIWHLLLNMLVLFFFGPPLESRWGSAEFLRYYLLCGLGGVLLSFIFAPGSAIIGASAAIYGLMLAFAWHWPEQPIYIWGIFPVPAKWLVGFFFVLTFITAFGGEGGRIAHFAHLGGLLAGLVYLRVGGRLKAGLAGMRDSRAAERFAIVPRRAPGAKASGGDGARGKAANAGREEDLLDEVDRILDKISARGLAALTEEERRLLDEVSRRRASN